MSLDKDKPFKARDVLALSKKELSTIVEYTHEIIDYLPDKALRELFEGGEQDTEQLVLDIMEATHQIFNCSDYTLQKFGGIENFEKTFDTAMKRLSYNYFKATMLPNFNQGWRNIEWGNMAQLYPWSAYLASRGHGKSYEWCFAFPIWRMWRYERPPFFVQDTIDNKNSKDTVLITNEGKLAKVHMEKIAEEIRMNSLLHEKLLPDDKTDIGIEKITTKNGANLIYRTYGSFIRGLHVGAVVVDDFLDESCLYSKDQRDKFDEIFSGAIKSIVEPGGYLLVSGTPYHDEDLYQKLKRDYMFKVFEYPAVFPDGRLLSPDRFSYKQLMDLKKSLGSIVFSREYMVTPVTDSSSIFPWEFLRKAFVGMENISFVENLDSFPIKMERIVIGCDFAISGNIGADYSVFTVWGRAQGNYYLLHVWRKSGASHNEQVNTIVRLNQMFNANTIVAENNGFQSIIIELAKERGVRNIEPFTTTSKVKKDSLEGVPSISAMFERGEIKIPYSETSRDMANLVCGEFNSITFRDANGKLESSSGHDDVVMSSFFAITQLREKKGAVRISYF